MKLLGNIRQVLKTLKRRKPSPIYCPRCASQNIHLSSGFDYWLTPKKYFCENCGYLGPIIMELEKEEDEQ